MSLCRDDRHKPTLGTCSRWSASRCGCANRTGSSRRLDRVLLTLYCIVTEIGDEAVYSPFVGSVLAAGGASGFVPISTALRDEACASHPQSFSSFVHTIACRQPMCQYVSAEIPLWKGNNHGCRKGRPLFELPSALRHVASGPVHGFRADELAVDVTRALAAVGRKGYLFAKPYSRRPL